MSVQELTAALRRQWANNCSRPEASVTEQPVLMKLIVGRLVGQIHRLFRGESSLRRMDIARAQRLMEEAGGRWPTHVVLDGHLLSPFMKRKRDRLTSFPA